MNSNSLKITAPTKKALEESKNTSKSEGISSLKTRNQTPGLNQLLVGKSLTFQLLYKFVFITIFRNRTTPTGKAS